MENQVAQLHGALVEALQSNHRFVPNQPVTVAEIYQDLIPYRVVRTSLGFALNADYEHALLQLLAGQGDLARIEPLEVREQLQHELASPNPNVGVFRNYAACDVFVAVPQSVREQRAPAQHASAEGNGGKAENGNGRVEAHLAAEQRAAPQVLSWEAALDRTVNPHEPVATEVVPQWRVEPTPAYVATASPAPTASPRKQCVACHAELPRPKDRDVLFCPYCGYDQAVTVCTACQAELEDGWKYCISCGTPVSGATGS
jgi:hypothetical protein